MGHSLKQALKLSRIFKASALALFIALGGMGGECSGVKNENEVTLPMTRCGAKEAQISVLDGFIQNHCGCQESTGQTLTNLTCTIPTGTTIFIHFGAAALRHQIVPVGSPAILTSPMYDPAAIPVVRTFGFILDGTPGDIYSFKDQFDPRLTGQFILVP